MNLMMSAPSHIPVLLEEAIEALAVQPGGRYIDCTLGGGGHAAAILGHSSPGGQLLGIDADPEAAKVARVKLEAYGSSALVINEVFVNLQAICFKYDFHPVHGILFDLGLSSLQLREPEHLESALKQAINLLGFEGRLVVISYLPLQDRIVKQFMQRESKDCICPPGTPVCVCGHTTSLRLVRRKVITPSLAEVEVNPRSRSAKLRVAERIIPREDYFKTAKKLCFSMENGAGAFRRPALLKRLQRTFSVP